MALETTETYISIEDAQDYAALMGLELPIDEAELESLLRRAAIYLDRLYMPRWIGLPHDDPAQLLAWPRYDMTTVPAALGHAQVELAALMYANDGKLPLSAPRVKKSTVKLEGLEESIEYADAEGYGANPYLDIERILFPYFDIISDTGVTLKPRLTMARSY